MTVEQAEIKPIDFQGHKVKEVEITLKRKNKEGFDNVYITTEKNMISVAFQDNTEDGRNVDSWDVQAPDYLQISSSDSFIGIIWKDENHDISLVYHIPNSEIELIKSTDGSLY